MHSARLLPGWLFAFSLSVSGATFPGEWSYLNPPPSPNTAWGLHAANGLWMAVGEGGLIATTPNAPGVDAVWTQQRSGTPRFLFDVGYSNGLWVVVGGEGAILTSPDGVSWTEREAPIGQAGLEAVYFGGNLWVAVGASGAILTSPDAVQWTLRDSGGSAPGYGVHYANGQWIVVGDSGLILTSSDGLSWSTRDSGTSMYLDDVQYGDGRWMAVGGSGTIVVSTDGVSWQSGKITVPGVVVRDLTRVHHAAGRWVVTATNGQIFHSPDAVSWQLAGTQGATTFFTDVHYSDGRWAATTQGPIYYAPDQTPPLQFAKSVGVTDQRIARIAVAQGRFVAGAVNGTVLTSTNGIRWESATVDTAPDLNLRNWIQGVAFGDGQWILAGDRDSIWRSPDAATWERVAFTDTTGFQSVDYADGQWLLVGNGGDIRTSVNGVDWTRQISGTGSRIRAACYADGTWVAVGVSGEVLTSPNGRDWTLRRRQTSAQANEQLWDIDHRGGRWVAAGQKGSGPSALILTSADARNWTPVAVTGSALQSVRCHDGLWVATGQLGTVLTSLDGTRWETVPPFTGTSLADSLLLNGAWILVGSQGLIARAATVLDPVTLSIALQGQDQVLLSWPAPADGWVMTSALNAEGPYLKLEAAATVVEGRHQVVVPKAGSRGFYRLRTE